MRAGYGGTMCIYLCLKLTMRCAAQSQWGSIRTPVFCYIHSIKSNSVDSSAAARPSGQTQPTTAQQLNAEVKSVDYSAAA